MLIFFYEKFFEFQFMIPFVTGEPAKPETVAQLKGPMTESLDQMEQHWLKDKPFLSGSSINIADILGACEVEQPSKLKKMNFLKRCGFFKLKRKLINFSYRSGFADYDPREGRPKLTSWLKRVSEETSPYYQKAHELLNKEAEKYDPKKQFSV